MRQSDKTLLKSVIESSKQRGYAHAPNEQRKKQRKRPVRRTKLTDMGSCVAQVTAAADPPEPSQEQPYPTDEGAAVGEGSPVATRQYWPPPPPPPPIDHEYADPARTDRGPPVAAPAPELQAADTSELDAWMSAPLPQAAAEELPPQSSSTGEIEQPGLGPWSMVPAGSIDTKEEPGIGPGPSTAD